MAFGRFRRADPAVTPVSDAVFEAALAAYGETKSHRVDRERLRRALEAAVKAAYADGYRVGSAAAEYNDTGCCR